MKVVLALAVVVTIGLLLVDIRGWLNGSKPVSRRQKWYRVGAAASMLVVLAMVMIGDGWTPNLITRMLYWMACFAVALVPVVLLLLDVHELRRGLERSHEERLALFTRIAEEERAKQNQPPPGQ